MNEKRPIVLIIDDDAQLLRYLAKLVRSVGLNARTFASADDFLKHEMPEAPCCIVLDVRMPGLSGLELHDRLLEQGIDAPVVFLTAHASVHMSVESMKKGAVDFIEKPFEDQELLDAIHHALEKARTALSEKSETDEIRNRFKTLTKRECEVFRLVVDGLLNKQIAYELGISEKTVKIHRGRVMYKMNAESLAHLVKISQKLSIEGIIV
jgi:FixJ family two-component response regulator